MTHYVCTALQHGSSSLIQYFTVSLHVMLRTLAIA